MKSNRVQYKKELTTTFEKEVVAFLNHREGGIIYIGIEENGSIFGVKEPDRLLLQIKDRFKNNILPSTLGLFDVLLENRKNKVVIRIALAGGMEKPYYMKKSGMTEKGCYIRIGSGSEPMPIKMIEELFASRTRNSIGKIKSNSQDLTFEQLKIYYSVSGFDHGEKFASNLELLTEDGSYNYAAYLLADANGNSVQVAKYRGLDRLDLIESNEYGYCSLVKSCKQVLDKLEVENRTVTKITPKKRISISLWDPIALREAVINAIIHNNYTNEAVPKFEIFDDRIEITSAGTIPLGIEREEFFQGYSIPQNRILMRIFKDIDMVEYLGSGMPRILKAYKRKSYIFTSNFIRTVFPVSLKALKLDGVSDKTTGKKTTGKKSTGKKSTGKKTTGKNRE
ncbi:MAG: putative DNA binding domain-containing protein [Candidatus Delongbacteria bacterium]|nr:putative DNA binding domain-containing protein [Candidatus Delongbacteria bacterium]